MLSPIPCSSKDTTHMGPDPGQSGNSAEEVPVQCISQDMCLEPTISSLVTLEDTNDLSSTIASKDTAEGLLVSSKHMIAEPPVQCFLPFDASVQAPDNFSIEVPYQASSTSANSNVSFKQMLKTPQKLSSPTVTLRKKAINSLAQELTIDIFLDMRLCQNCASYVHEECVGLTASDKDNFICIQCED
ncbi:hypothetical protein ACJJTC_007893 [Scirpophaga incertulas]